MRLPAAVTVAVLAVGLILSGCAIRSTHDGSAQTDPSSSAVPIVGTAGTLPAEGIEPTEAAGAFAAPNSSPTRVIDSDFPDPDVIESNGVFYAYSTNSGGKNAQVASSDDLVTWSILATDALPRLPGWANGRAGYTWAPDVLELAPSRFAMYFTTSSRGTNLQCIGIATSSRPSGPFVPVGEKPLVCPQDLGGAIDAASFRDDDGTIHLVWKTNGNCCGLGTSIQEVALTADGTQVAGTPNTLITAGLEWETGNIEGPTLIRRDGLYHLFYSASSYVSEGYSIGHATAPSLSGPWTKDCEPVLSSWSGLGLNGPGGQDLLTNAVGNSAMFLAAWDSAHKYRGMYLVPLAWQGHHPVVPGATTSDAAPRASSGCDSTANGLVIAAE